MIYHFRNAFVHLTKDYHLQNELNMANKQIKYQGYMPPFTLSLTAVEIIAEIQNPWQNNAV